MMQDEKTTPGIKSSKPTDPQHFIEWLKRNNKDEYNEILARYRQKYWGMDTNGEPVKKTSIML